MLEIALCSLLLGVFLTILIQALWIKRKFGNLPRLSSPIKDQFPKIQLPQILKDKATSPDHGKKPERCLWFNLLVQFLFRELRDTQEVRRWVMKKMHQEFQELLQTTSGKLLEQITVRDFSLGTTFPIVNCVSINKVAVAEGGNGIEELDLGLEVEYSGGSQLAVDVSLMFNKSAYLSVTLKKLKGLARLQLTRIPYTHWSFSFYEEPEVDFAVESQFENRAIPQIASLVVNQLRRSIRKKHTLPNYKMRFRPFFFKPEPSRPLRDLKVNGQNISVGRLKVTVVECSRLLRTPRDSFLYCTVQVDSLSWKDLITQQRVWIPHDVEIFKEQAQSVGMSFREEHLLDRFEVVVIVDSITPDSPASLANIRKNDVLIAVGSTKISSSRQAAKLIKNAGEKFTIRLERPQTKMPQEAKFLEEAVSFKDAESEAGEESLMLEDGEEFVHISFKTHDGETQSLKSLKLDKPEKARSLSVPIAGDLRLRSKGSVSEQKQPNPSPRLRRKFEQRIQTPESPSSSLKRDSSPRRDFLDSDPDLVIKGMVDDGDLSCDMDCGGSDSDDDTFSIQKTPEVPACKNPKWSKDVMFDITENHHYLNLCVRCKILEKVDKSEKVIKPQQDLLLGHVSLPISDISLHCLLTLQGDTTQMYHLQPGEMKAGASRTKNNWSTHPGFESHLCYGDITLGFVFTAMNLSDVERMRLTKEPVDPTVVESTSSKENSQENGISDGTGIANLPEEGLHCFRGTQFHSVTYCNFCGKKIWMKVAFKCNMCTMICHKKCMEKCLNETLCTKEGVKKRSCPMEAWKTPVTARKKTSQEEREGISRTGRLLSKFRKDTGPLSVRGEQSGTQKSPSGSPVLGRRTPEASSSPAPSPRPSPRPSPQPPRKMQFIKHNPDIGQTESTYGILQDSSEDSDDEKRSVRGMQNKPVKRRGQNLDEVVVMTAKQMGKELFAHLSVEERKEKLDTMVSKLQQEIDGESDNKTELSRAAKETTDLLQRQFLEQQISKSDEKVEALMMLLLQYCAGLQHCLDMEEEEKQKNEDPREAILQEPDQGQQEDGDEEEEETPGKPEDANSVASGII